MHRIQSLSNYSNRLSSDVDMPFFLFANSMESICERLKNNTKEKQIKLLLLLEVLNFKSISCFVIPTYFYARNRARNPRNTINKKAVVQCIYLLVSLRVWIYPLTSDSGFQGSTHYANQTLTSCSLKQFMHVVNWCVWVASPLQTPHWSACGLRRLSQCPVAMESLSKQNIILPADRMSGRLSFKR